MKYFLTIAWTLVFLTACGVDLHNAPIENLVASAVISGSVAAASGEQVTLSATLVSDTAKDETTDLDGDRIIFRWKQLSGTPVSTSAKDQPQLVFTAPSKSETLVFGVSVDDGISLGPQVVHEIRILYNSVPEAKIDLNHEVRNTKTATLVGSGSNPDGLFIDAYAWRVVGAPIGATWVAAATDTAILQIQPFGVGIYQLGFKVRSGTQWSQEQVALLTAQNNVPSIIPSADANIANGTTVAVWGTVSDPDGDAMTYEWVVLSAPNGVTVSWSDRTDFWTEFAPFGKGQYVLQLRATDSHGGVGSVNINVTAKNNVPVAAANNRSGQNLALGTLDASGIDPDGDPVSFSWTLVTAPSAASPTLSGTNSAQLTITADKKGSYVFALIPRDGVANGSTVYVTYTATNNAPTAHAGFDQPSANGGGLVQLDGSLSSDVDGDSIVQYNWTQIAGSTVQLSGNNSATAASPTFTAPNTKETLTFQLVVSDGTDWSDADYVQATVSNFAPVANAGNDRYAPVNATVQLLGTGTDADGDTLTGGKWAQISGSAIVFSDSNITNPTFTMPNILADQIELGFQVSDGKTWSTVDSIVLTAAPGDACCVFVSASGSASGDGTAANPFTTITAALAPARAAGKIVVVADGTYGYTSVGDSNAVSLYGSYVSDGASLWQPSPVQYQTIIQGDGGSTQTRSLTLGTMTNAQITVSGFYIRMGGGDGTGVTSRYGLVCGSCWVIIENNKIEVDGRNSQNTYGIYLAGNAQITVRNNLINSGYGSQKNAAVYLNNPSDVIVDGNTIDLRNSIGTTTYKYGLWVNGTTADPLIENNRFFLHGSATYDSACFGIYFANNNAGTSNSIINNIFVLDFACNGSGIADLYERKGNNSGANLYHAGDDWTVRHNLFYGSGNDLETGLVYGLYFNENIVGNHYTMNNIFHDLATGIRWAYGADGWRANGYEFNNAFFSNLCDIANGGCISDATAQGQFPVIGSCSFVSAGAGDFSLNAGSPCIDQGRAWYSTTTDIIGNPRPVDWPGVGNGNGSSGQDIGPYEMPLP